MTPPGISDSQVLSLLNDTLGLEVQTVHVLRPGAWSAAFGFSHLSDEYVVRFSYHRDDFERDAYASRFASESLPVPKVPHRGNLGDIYYAVSGRVRGGFIDDLSGENYRRTLPSLLTMLDALRVADVSTSTGYGTWDADGNGIHASWPEFLRASLEDSPNFRGGRWRPKLELSPGGAAPFDRDFVVFERLMNDMPNIRHVIHSDLLNYNAFVKDFRISGLIDWGCAIYGDFVYELAWFSFWSPWYPQWQGIDVTSAAFDRLKHIDVDLSGFRERLLCYQLHIGLTHQAYNASIGNWNDLADVARHTAALADEVR